MSGPIPQLDDEHRAALNRSLQRLHRCVLGLLAACALAVVLAPGVAWGDALPPRSYTLVAIGLALGVVLSRRLSTSPVVRVRARTRLAVASLVFAALLGLVAAALGVQHGATQPALVFTLAAAVFVLRPPRVADAPTGSTATSSSRRAGR